METCDRCAARAANKANHLASGAELFLCQHHTNAHIDELMTQGWTVYSLEAELVPRKKGWSL